MIQKLFEAHLHVRYLERAMAFYEKIVGLKLGRLESARRAAFYWVGGHNISMLGLWEKIPVKSSISTLPLKFRSLK